MLREEVIIFRIVWIAGIICLRKCVVKGSIIQVDNLDKEVGEISSVSYRGKHSNC